MNGTSSASSTFEWACARLLETIRPPYRLSNQSIDTVRLEDYESLHAEFMKVFEEEEDRRLHLGCNRSPFQLHPILRQGWERGTFWCALPHLRVQTAFVLDLYDYIQPKLSKTHVDEKSFWLITMRYWMFDTNDFLERKLEEKE